MIRHLPKILICSVIATGIGAIVLFSGDEISKDKLAEKYDNATAVKAIYQLDGTSLKSTPKDDPKDMIRVTIGDKDAQEFIPNLTISRWDEVDLMIKPVAIDSVADKDKDLIFEGETIKLITPKINYRMYELPISAENHEGGYEFEIILKEKPATNKIEFTIDTKGLEFFYQPELTQEQKDRGDIRPEKVVGSYAVYTSEKKTNWDGGKLYRTGKVGHIFRPKATDSIGNWAWEELKIENGLLTITIPQDFLDKAIYPVTSKGVNFGYEAEGGSASYSQADGVGLQITSAGVGTGTSMNVYISAYSDSYLGGYSMALYNYNSGGSANKVGNTSVGTTITCAGGCWQPLNFSGSPSIVAQDYGAFYTWEKYTYYYYDADTGTSTVTPGIYTNPWPATITATYYGSNYNYSIYATYTEGGGAVTVPSQDIIIFE